MCRTKERQVICQVIKASRECYSKSFNQSQLNSGCRLLILFYLTLCNIFMEHGGTLLQY